MRSLSRLVKLAISCVYFLLFRTCNGVRTLAAPKPCGLGVVLCYHACPARHRSRFAHQMDLLMKHAKIVRPDWNGVAYPGRITAAVTFDDGYRSVLSVALPELRRRGIPFAIF